MTKGEGLSGYYRFMNQFGQFIWLQSRATLMFDSRTGKPSYIVCMNFVIRYVFVWGGRGGGIYPYMHAYTCTYYYCELNDERLSKSLPYWLK